MYKFLWLDWYRCDSIPRT